MTTTLTSRLLDGADHGPLPRSPHLVADLEAAGLTGRGGAAFPVHRKLRLVAQHPSPVVIANGAEGEPASRKDVTLMTAAPHLVLDGLQAAAAAAGAARTVAYVHRGPAVAAMRRAIGTRPIELVEAEDAFVSGQESAVWRAVQGGPARPRTGRPAGVLVQNVETLAHVGLIARYGPDWFRALGTPDEPGTMLVTIAGEVSEVAIGTPLADLLPGDLRGVLVGGYHGTWLHADEIATLSLSRASLGEVGGSPGAGVLLPLALDTCPLVATSRITDYLAGQSARQCGPCLNGLPALAAAVKRLSRDGSGLARVHELTGLVEGRGACKHPDGTVRLVRSALEAFPEEVDAHASGRCLAS